MKTLLVLLVILALVAYAAYKVYQRYGAGAPKGNAEFGEPKKESVYLGGLSKPRAETVQQSVDYTRRPNGSRRVPGGVPTLPAPVVIPPTDYTQYDNDTSSRSDYDSNTGTHQSSNAVDYNPPYSPPSTSSYDSGSSSSYDSGSSFSSSDSGSSGGSY